MHGQDLHTSSGNPTTILQGVKNKRHHQVWICVNKNWNDEVRWFIEFVKVISQVARDTHPSELFQSHE